MKETLKRPLLTAGLLALGSVLPGSCPADCSDYMGEFWGIAAYSNGSETGGEGACAGWGDYGWQYQCLEYVNRLYSIKFGIPITGVGYARYLYGKASEYGLEQHPNGGDTPPQPADILCFDGGWAGHVAIIMEVYDDRIVFIEQNWGPPEGQWRGELARNGNWISDRGSYWVQGWLRVPGFQWDTEGPTISWAGSMGRHKWTNDPDRHVVQWVLSDQSGVKGFNQAWDSPPDGWPPRYENYAGFLTFEDAGEGWHTAGVRSWDKCSPPHESLDYYGPVGYDASAPYELSHSFSPASPSNADTVTIWFSMADKYCGPKLSQVYVDGDQKGTIDGASGSFDWMTGGYGDGAHTIKFRMYDKLDNKGWTQGYEYVLDTTAPWVGAVQIRDRNENGGSVTSGGLISFSCFGTFSFGGQAGDQTSGVADVLYRVQGNDWPDEQSRSLDPEDPANWSWSPAKRLQGLNHFWFKAVDRATNESAEYAVDVGVDLEPPHTTLEKSPSEPEGGWYKSAPVTVAVDAWDEGSGEFVPFAAGVAETCYRINGGEWTCAPPPIELQFTEEGDYHIDYYSRDAVEFYSNSEAVQHTSVRIDWTPAQMLDEGAIDEGDYTLSWNTLACTFHASDNVSGVWHYEYCIGTSEGSDDVWPWTLTEEPYAYVSGLALEWGEDAPEYYFTVRCQDFAGNAWSDPVTSDGIVCRACPLYYGFGVFDCAGGQTNPDGSIMHSEEVGIYDSLGQMVIGRTETEDDVGEKEPKEVIHGMWYVPLEWTTSPYVGDPQVPWINAGWNWISFPLIPQWPDAQSILGYENAYHMLYRLEPQHQTPSDKFEQEPRRLGQESYLEVYPDDFTDVETARGYLLESSGDQVPTYIGEPVEQDYSVLADTGGWTWVGLPFNRPVWLPEVRVRCGGEERLAWQDALNPHPWVDWHWRFLYSPTEEIGWAAFDQSGWYEDLYPWWGYRVWVYKRGVEIIFPARSSY